MARRPIEKWRKVVRRILLTGAGFSRNWGGWLASETFEYLLGSEHVDDGLRARLWDSKERGNGFEDVLAELQAMSESGTNVQCEQELENLTDAIIAMFADMAEGFTTVLPDEESGRDVRTFLANFDAIYTVNQDTLIEQNYTGGFGYGGRVANCRTPGVTPIDPNLGKHRTWKQSYTPDPGNFTIRAQTQPYIKLHGSYNWTYGERNFLLVLGGNKVAGIEKHPLLAWYHNLLREELRRPNTRLMVVGYSFNDSHINAAILEAAKETDLRVFIVDPLGVDVLDKRNARVGAALAPELFTILAPRVIGASRRPLTSTFGTDVVEHAKVMKFFN
jgi:hypothetical protein